MIFSIRSRIDPHRIKSLLALPVTTLCLAAEKRRCGRRTHDNIAQP
jgi:hypothetical protein